MKAVHDQATKSPKRKVSAALWESIRGNPLEGIHSRALTFDLLSVAATERGQYNDIQGWLRWDEVS